jgi:hypothetical protein
MVDPTLWPGTRTSTAMTGMRWPVMAFQSHCNCCAPIKKKRKKKFRVLEFRTLFQKASQKKKKNLADFLGDNCNAANLLLGALFLSLFSLRFLALAFLLAIHALAGVVTIGSLGLLLLLRLVCLFWDSVGGRGNILCCLFLGLGSLPLPCLISRATKEIERIRTSRFINEC